MSGNVERPAWMEDELVKNIPQKKLAFLEKMFIEGHGKNQKEMMQFMIPMMKKAQQEKLTFTAQEMNAAITAIKRHSTEEEIAQMDKILEKAHNNKNGGN